MSEKYNGWTNRETWLVNLHFGDDTLNLAEIVQIHNEDEDRIAQALEAMVTEHVEEIVGNKSIFVSDLINLSAIDWLELAQAYIEDYHIEEEEESE